MFNQQKFLKMGMLEEKKREMAQTVTAIKARVDSVSLAIMPEMGPEDWNFEQAKIMIDECVSLKTKYNDLKKAIRDLEESI